MSDGILHHVIRWNVPFLRYGVKRINHAILPALFCSFYYRSAVVQRRVVRQSDAVNQDSTQCAVSDAFYKGRTGGRTSPQHQ